jgi:hypothetical protein
MGIRNDSHHYGGDYEQFNRKFMRLVRGGVSARPWWDTSNPNERWAFAEIFTCSRRNVERFESFPSHQLF